MHLIRHREELLEQFDEDILRRINALFLMIEHLDAGIDEEDTKDAQYPFETLHHRCTRKDKDAPEDQGTEDAPEQHLMLVFPLDAEE